MKVGLLVIATGKYTRFLDQLYRSVKQFFLTGHDLTVFVFTDQPHKAPRGCVVLPWEHAAWPFPSMYRYRMFTQYRTVLEKNEYLYYCDVDMRFVSSVGDEVLGDLVAVVHPEMYDKPRDQFSYEQNGQRKVLSLAYIHPCEGLKYYCNGFNGGKAPVFLDMAAQLAKNVDTDLKNNV
ncbi:MAG: hypothetical protein JRC86_11950, partial [Deltaproteobacteria bacterium]|nr:hypothetical protein [Deltaproteobacteria bacterium]